LFVFLEHNRLMIRHGRWQNIPTLARSNYRLEWRHILLWGALVGVIEGNVAGIVAKKTFDAPDWLTSVIWALPISVNILNLLWGMVIRGRRIVPMFAVLASCATACVASIALTSPRWGPLAAYTFGLQLALTHVFMSGLLTLRAAIWRFNYPHTHRARIISRLQTLRFVLVVAAGAAASGMFDVNPALYRLVYPGVAAAGLLSLLPLRRIRVRGERKELRAWQGMQQVNEGKSTVARFVGGLHEAGGILRSDQPFRRYLTAQFFLGSAKFFTDATLVVVLAGTLGYLATSLTMIQIPLMLRLISIRLWAPYFDRVGVVRFRVVNSMLWIASYVCIATSMIAIGWFGNRVLPLAVPVLLLARLINGTAGGGGSLAWTLGHLQFARPHQSELYMGIHAALTGVRGLIVPPLGTLANGLIGNTSFAIPIVLAAVANVLFRRAARVTPARPLTEPVRLDAAEV
jgi:hypothetical protein